MLEGIKEFGRSIKNNPKRSIKIGLSVTGAIVGITIATIFAYKPIPEIDGSKDVLENDGVPTNN